MFIHLTKKNVIIFIILFSGKPSLKLNNLFDLTSNYRKSLFETRHWGDERVDWRI